MEFVFGLVGKDFTLLCSDGNAARSIICYQQNHDRIIELNKHNALAMSGDPGDVEQFSTFVKANMQLYSMRNNYETSPAETSCYTRRQLATAIRKNPYNVMLLSGGFDTMEDKPSLHYMGMYGSMVSVPFAAHGYGQMFTCSLLDRWYRPDLTEEQAIELFKKVCQELQRRFICNLPTFKLKKIDKDGVTDLGWMKFTKDIEISQSNPASGMEPQFMSQAQS